MTFELGVLTFGEITTDPHTGVVLSPGERMRETIEQAEVAEQVGLDVFGVGEHHRTDFIASAPPVILAAVAARTKRIRLTSSVTVLSADDPVRVWQQFATLDLISGGRAEIIAGRGSYGEAFPLFGHDLNDYADLYREKLELLLAIRDRNPLTWEGRFRPPLADADIAPRAFGDTLPIWVGVGGSPASAVSTGRLGLPMALAALMGPIGMHQQAVALYHGAAAQAGHDESTLRVSINAPGHLNRNSRQARDEMHPYFSLAMSENGHQRGQRFEIPRGAFNASGSRGGALLVGSPQEIIDKLMAYHELYGVSRALLQLGFGGMPQKEHLQAIELLGTEVAPVVRRELAAVKEAAA